MGSWLLKAVGRDTHALGFDLDRQAGSLAAFGPDMLINCVPLGRTVEAFREVEPELPRNCILSDIASVKTGLGEYYRESGRPFVSTHPMFGPTWSDERDLRGQNAIIIEESCPEGAAFWKRLYDGLGVRVWHEDFQSHDGTIAYSLAIPFASTMAFAACMRRLDAPGTTFSKHLDIARGLLKENDELLSEILLNPHAARSLELVGSRLSLLAHILRDRDKTALSEFFAGLRDRLDLRT